LLGDTKEKFRKNQHIRPPETAKEKRCVKRENPYGISYEDIFGFFSAATISEKKRTRSSLPSLSFDCIWFSFSGSRVNPFCDDSPFLRTYHTRLFLCGDSF